MTPTTIPALLLALEMDPLGQAADLLTIAIAIAALAIAIVWVLGPYKPPCDPQPEGQPGEDTGEIQAWEQGP